MNLRQGQRGIEVPQGEAKLMVRQLCGPLLEIMEDETVQIFHHSLTEFLSDESRDESSTGFPILRPCDAHKAIVLTSLEYLRFDCFSSDWPKKYIKPGNDRRYHHLATHYKKTWGDRSKNYPLLNYVAGNWPHHVSKSACVDAEFFEVINEFLVKESHSFKGIALLSFTSEMLLAREKGSSFEL
jgi:hypothetical protein